MVANQFGISKPTASYISFFHIDKSTFQVNFKVDGDSKAESFNEKLPIKQKKSFCISTDIPDHEKK